MKRTLLLIGWLLMASALAMAQGPNEGAVMRQNPFPSGQAVTQLPFYDGSGNIIYLCSAAAIQNGPTHAPIWAKTPTGPQLTLSNIVVLTNVGTINVSGSTIKLQIGNAVVVSGSTTSALNGTYQVVTTPSATSVTIATSGVADATYQTANLQVTSTAPRTDDFVWSINKYTNTGVNLTLIQTSNGNSGNYSAICDNRATTTIYQ